jgi:hypothetical protein
MNGNRLWMRVYDYLDGVQEAGGEIIDAWFETDPAYYGVAVVIMKVECKGNTRLEIMTGTLGWPIM